MMVPFDKVDKLSCDIEWLPKHFVVTKLYFYLVKALTGETIDLWSILGRFFGGVRP